MGVPGSQAAVRVRVLRILLGGLQQDGEVPVERLAIGDRIGGFAAALAMAV